MTAERRTAVHTDTRHGERSLVLITLGVAALAWATLAVQAGVGEAGHLHQHQPTSTSGALDLAFFAVVWLVAVAAMALPRSVPVLSAIHRLLATAEHPYRLLAIGTVALVATIGWTALAVFAPVDGAAQLHHHTLTASPSRVEPAAFLVAWLVMVTAMMLPPSLRFVSAIHRLVGEREHPYRLVAIAVGAYAVPWLIVGEFFRVGDIGVQRIIQEWGWLAEHTEIVTAATLLVAGAYQLAPLKLRCLRGCRNPTGFVARGWRGVEPELDLVRIGVAYGWSCVGCCWALMLLMFAGGVTSFALMLALTAVMVVERVVRRVGQSVAVLGALLILSGVLVMVGRMPSLSG